MRGVAADTGNRARNGREQAMPTIQVAREFIVAGSAATPEFFYTQGFPAGGLSGVHVSATVLAMSVTSGSPSVGLYVQWSSTLDAWNWLAGAPSPMTRLLDFTGVESKQGSISPSSPSPFNVAAGGRWLRLALRVDGHRRRNIDSECHQEQPDRPRAQRRSVRASSSGGHCGLLRHNRGHSQHTQFVNNCTVKR